MGRGLSSLQKSILKTAVKVQKCRTSNWRDGTPDLLRAEVMMHFYHFTPAPSQQRRGRGARAVHLRSWNGWQYRGNIYSVAEIGRSNYDAAKTSISRAVRRLQQRGLIGSDCLRGINLTEAGWEEAYRYTYGQLATSIPLAETEAVDER